MEIKNRYDFVYYVEASNANPNGDPDADNQPRIDPVDRHGLMTDVSQKRKVRNFVEMTKSREDGYEIFIKERSVLNHAIEGAYSNEEVKSALEAWKKVKGPERSRLGLKHPEDLARDWLCKKFFDIRCFGAVLSTGSEEKDESDAKSKIKLKAGQVRGPVQFTFSRSIDPVDLDMSTITRVAVTNEKDVDKERTMGRKHFVSYGLYRMHGFVSPYFAEKTFFGNSDLELLFEALTKMYWHGNSSSKAGMNVRGLYLFKHDTPLGEAHAHSLFERITEAKLAEDKSPRSFSDYSVLFDGKSVEVGESLQAAPGVTLTRRC